MAWTQERLADALGISPQFLSDVLLGKKAPSPEHLADWSPWTFALGLTGADAEAFADALHIAAAAYYAPRAAILLERMDASVKKAEEWKAECDRRIMRAREALDYLDPQVKLKAAEPKQSYLNEPPSERGETQ